MSYESPITIAYDIAHQVSIEIENGVYKAVINAGIDVNKEELIRALQYDRNQYEKGYADGKNHAIVHAHWIGTEFDGYADGYPVYNVFECSNCGQEHYGEEDTLTTYCPHCGAKMDEEKSL